MIKKGDTLIEVTLAIGIFSMVAVSVVAVMGNGTAGAETALETTLTREEIDAQADALRFIHSSYLSDHKHEDDRYSKLWTAITEKAIDLKSSNVDIVTYSPTTCDALYTKGEGDTNSPLGNQNAFVINTDYLGSYSNDPFNGSDKETLIKNAVKKAVVRYNDDNNKFKIASTYPHLIYQNQKNETEDQSVLTDNYDNFARAEGIYVIAVKDAGTEITGEDSFETVSAFYDFYIRTCWYGVGDEFPSTISTVIRLYNPDVIVARKIQPSEPESEPEPEPTSNYLQNQNNSTLSAAMPYNGNTASYVDSRDGEVYKIVRLKDRYWFLDNLRLDLTKEETIAKVNADNTNASAASIEHLKTGNGDE